MQHTRRRCGFSLIEVLIVIAIILIIAAIAVPPMNEQLRIAHETAAIEQIRTIHAAETQYYAQSGRYAPSLAEFGTASLVPKALAGGTKNGYIFAVQATQAGYAVTANPQSFGGTGRRTFYSDHTLVIRNSATAEPATADSPEIP